jgi:hypothetical protein
LNQLPKPAALFCNSDSVAVILQRLFCSVEGEGDTIGIDTDRYAAEQALHFRTDSFPLALLLASSLRLFHRHRLTGLRKLNDLEANSVKLISNRFDPQVL